MFAVVSWISVRFLGWISSCRDICHPRLTSATGLPYILNRRKSGGNVGAESKWTRDGCQ